MTAPLHVEGKMAIEIHFSGGSLLQMQHWLGPQLAYHPQSGGGLGHRLNDAFVQGFQAGLERIVIIGSDCPEIDATHLEQAFCQLHSHDVVLGPAQDGGYYLVGLRRACAELFQGITWGTEQVFKQTVAIATQLGLSLATLETLRDVDRPEDIAIAAGALCLAPYPLAFPPQ